MTTFSLAPLRRPRRPSLTPMIDVVFLLLVFFMLVSRFGTDHALELPTASLGGEWIGPPRLIDIGANGLRLNGVSVTQADLVDQMAPLVQSTDDPIILRSGPDVDVQSLITIMDHLKQAGFTALLVVE